MHVNAPESHYNGLQPQNMPMGALCAKSQPASNVGSWAVYTPHPAITGERRITTKTEGGERSTASQPALTEPYYMRERKTHARREKGTAPPNTAFQSEAPCLDSYRSLETIASAYKKAYEGKLK